MPMCRYSPPLPFFRWLGGNFLELFATIGICEADFMADVLKKLGKRREAAADDTDSNLNVTVARLDLIRGKETNAGIFSPPYAHHRNTISEVFCSQKINRMNGTNNACNASTGESQYRDYHGEYYRRTKDPRQILLIRPIFFLTPFANSKSYVEVESEFETRKESCSMKP